MRLTSLGPCELPAADAYPVPMEFGFHSGAASRPAQFSELVHLDQILIDLIVEAPPFDRRVALCNLCCFLDRPGPNDEQVILNPGMIARGDELSLLVQVINEPQASALISNVEGWGIRAS